jgi:ABC-type Fe3+/spermidine/putrescine transport system ATPase subunit
MSFRLSNGRELFVPAVVDAVAGKKAMMAIRPQNIQLIDDARGGTTDPNIFSVKIVGGQYLGTYYEYIVNDSDKDFLFHTRKEIHGDHATVHFDPAECSVFLK